MKPGTLYLKVQVSVRHKGAAETNEPEKYYKLIVGITKEAIREYQEQNPKVQEAAIPKNIADQTACDFVAGQESFGGYTMSNDPSIEYADVPNDTLHSVNVADGITVWTQ
jgi:hypothetical protein